MSEALLIRDLDVRFTLPRGTVHAVAGVDLDMRTGECLGIVGESGAGKTQLVLALLGLLAANATVQGSALFGGVDLLRCSVRALNQVRGRQIGMVFQDPMTSLTPHRRVGEQVVEVLRYHRGLRGDEATARARNLLEQVRVPDAAGRFRQYPHELSGGMRQRVMIAIAIACEPRLLIADEPTSALDVTVQAEVLDLLRELRREMQLGIVLITHDLGVVADLADRVAVMYAGRVVEEASASNLLRSPRHPYTAALLNSTPRLSDAVDSDLVTIAGHPPDLHTRLAGCSFAPRCAAATAECTTVTPLPSREAGDRVFECHHPLRSGA